MSVSKLGKGAGAINSTLTVLLAMAACINSGACVGAQEAAKKEYLTKQVRLLGLQPYSPKQEFIHHI